MLVSINNTEIHLGVEHLENFSPVLRGWKQYIFIGLSVTAMGLAYFVQRAVYRSLKNLGPRPINQMIIPSQVRLHNYTECTSPTCKFVNQS